MTKFEELDFSSIAKHFYDAFIVRRPDVLVEGLFRLDHRFYIVAPSADPSTEAGAALQKWFNGFRPLGRPFELVAARPTGAEEVPSRTVLQIAQSMGADRTIVNLERSLSVSLPKDFPFVSADEQDNEFIVRVSRELTTAEEVILEAAFDALGCPSPMCTEVVQLASEELVQAERSVTQYHEFELAISTAALLGARIPRSVRDLVSADEDCWRAEGVDFLTGRESAQHGHKIDTQDSGACLVGTTFAPTNIRSYLSLYSTVCIVAPLVHRVDETVQALGVSRQDLLELSAHGFVRWLLPQSVERYDLRWLASLAEAAPHSLLVSRRLALLAARDQRKRNPLYSLPATAFERRAMLRALLRLGEDNSPQGIFFRTLATSLSRYWAFAEYVLHTQGAMASASGGLAHHATEMVKAVTNRDLFIELGACAQDVEWAGALGATLIPQESDGYSAAGAARFLVALTSGGDRKPVATKSPREVQLAQELLAFANDTNVLEFVNEIGRGDFARFRILAGSISTKGTEEEIEENVKMWNAQVRHYERRPDRIVSFGIAGIVLAAAAQLAPNETVRSVVPLLAPLMPLILAQLNLEGIRESPTVGALSDWANGNLANAAPGAVLLSRMRKRIAGMKEIL